MHSITKISIKNYKSIINASFEISKYTPLVGRNNAGKSNILEAIEWIINKKSLSEVHFRNIAFPVEVCAIISGLTSKLLNKIDVKHQSSIIALVKNNKIKIRRTQFFPNDKVSNIKFEIFDKRKDNNCWFIPKFGLEKVIIGLFSEPIFIGAMENAGEDASKYGSNTTVGKLLNLIFEPIKAEYETEFIDSIKDISEKFTAKSSNKDSTLVTLDQRINEQLSKLFVDIKAETHIPIPTIDDLFKGSTINITDESTSHLRTGVVNSFGHGTQRALQIALIKCLADQNRKKTSIFRTIILLIDEPELYLHPQAIELVRSAISSLAGESYQIIFTTHSPMMITRKDVLMTLIIRNDIKGTISLPTIKSKIKNFVVDKDSQFELFFQIGNISKILFSDTILLIEGKTEKILIPQIFEYITNKTLSEFKIGILSLNGVGNLNIIMDILKAIGISCKAIVDLDYAFRGAVNASLIQQDDNSLGYCKKVLSTLKLTGQINLSNDGLPKSHNGKPASYGFELMAEDCNAQAHIKILATKLLESNIMLWQRGAIEKHFNLQSKSSSTHAKFINKLTKNGFTKSDLVFIEIINLINWIKHQS